MSIKDCPVQPQAIHLLRGLRRQPKASRTRPRTSPDNLDDKDNARLIVSQIVLDTLHKLKMTYPKTTANRRRELKAIGKLLKK